MLTGKAESLGSPRMEIEVEVNPNSDVADAEIDRLKRPGWRSLFNFTNRIHLFPLSLAFILSVASGIIIPVLAVLLGKIFGLFTDFGANKISGSELIKKVSVYGIALVGLGSASGLLNAGYFMVWLIFGELQAKSVRDRLFDGMLEKDMEWYDMRKNGVESLISRLQTQIRELQMATSQPLGFAVQYTVTTLVALGVAFYTAWALTFVTLATLPFSAVILAWISARMQPCIETQGESLNQASKLADNALSAIDTVKCFNGQDYEVWQYSRSIKTAAQSYLKQARANALQIGFVRLVTLGMFVQGFWYGSHLVANGNKTPGQILTAFWACLMATQAIEQILPQMIVLEKGRAAGATLEAILAQMQTGRKVIRTNGGLTPGYCDGDIEVRNVRGCELPAFQSPLTRQVSFSYPSRPEQLALDSASFFFPAGETTFVIGKSGSGKSTLGNLLMRFYVPDSGDLLIDGNSIHELDINWLRNNMTLVQQQSVLFNETVFKNIAFGRRDHNKVRKQEVKRSIETAQLQNTIAELPLGLDTVVGTGGSAMSGGQRQRVAIARARLRDTPILILDEATSALDYISRTSVMEAIREWRRGKTTIIVTHDMSQIQENEYAYVLDNGVLIHEGFRQALERSETGPFERASSRGNNFPVAQNGMQTRKSAGPSDEVSTDPMDVHFAPRRHFIPSVFAPSPNDLRFRRPSQSLMSPLSPVALPFNRMSTIPPTFTQPRSNNLPAMDVFDYIPSMQIYPLEEGDRELRDSRYSMGIPRNSASTLHQGRRGSRILTTALKQKRLIPARRRRLTTDEKARRIAPVRKILMTVWPTLHWKKRVTLISGFFFASIHAGGTPAFSWVFSKLLATFFLTSNRSQMALKWSLSVLGVAIVDAIASYSMHYLLESCGQAWVDSLRIQALRRILDQPRAWFDRDKNKLSKLTECLDRNAEEMRNLVGRFAGFGFVAVTMMLMAIVWSLALCWRLTLVGLASGPFLYAITRSFEAVSGKWESKSNDASEDASAIFTETFGNIRVVRALTLEGYFHKKYAKATNRAMTVGLKRSAYSGFFFGLSDCGIIFVTALIFYYGAVLVSSGRYSVADILTVFTMLLFSMANANAIIAFIPQMNSSRDTATRLLRLSNLPYRSSHEHSGHVRLSEPGVIAFRSLSFAYPSRPETSVLSNLNLKINSKTSTALVGASGSGKSTITSLLLGLYPPTSGSLTFSSFSISDLHLPTLRDLISVVPQSPTLFPTTIAKNITYGLPETSPLATMHRVCAACVAAGIHDFISSLPDGYQTLVGKGGTGLSGGQTQRIVIARAVVRKPQLLILDEATSGLDGESAKVVRDMVGRMEREGIGVVVVAHDKEMMKACREVVVLGEGGKVMERGSFDWLVSHGEGELRRLIGRK